VFVDSADNLFFVDSGNNRVREVVAATGNIRTAAENGTAGFSLSSGAFVDSAGNIFFTDNNRIREVAAGTGNIRTVAGNGIAGFSGDGGLATSAELNNPSSVFVDNSGNIFFWDTGNNRIREVVAATGKIQSVAGTAPPVFVDSAGNIFFVISGPPRIGSPPGIILLEVVMATGKTQTVAGNGGSQCGGDGGPATDACVSAAGQVFVDSAGNIFIADIFNDRIREVVKATGIIQTVAGNGTFGFAGDGGPATGAGFRSPYGVFVDGSGNIFIADTDNNRIREVASPAQLTPNTLVFPALAVGTPSGAKTVTLSNKGSTTLAINSITITGANSGDFAQTNTCGTGPPAGTNCEFSVTFKPTAVGLRSAFVTIINNPSSSSQGISLFGSGPDFSVAIAQGSSSTTAVTVGQTATFSLELTVVGASQSLSLSCTGAPPQATCMVPTAASVMLGTPATVNVIVNTKANGLLIPTPPSSRMRTPWNRLRILWVLSMLLMLLWLRRCKEAEARAWAARPAFAASVLLLAMLGVVMSGCGGGGSSTPPPPLNNGTPVGTYTLTVTAASGNLTHTQQLTLTVQ
jgi:centrosomal CEP192-like protein